MSPSNTLTNAIPEIAAITPAGVTFDASSLGLDDVQVASVRALLTRYSMVRRRNPPANDTAYGQHLGRTILAWGETPLAGSPAPLAEFAPVSRSWSVQDVLAGGSVAGTPITAMALRRAWDLMDDEEIAERERVLPDELLVTLMPAEWWPAISAFIAEDHAVKVKRLNTYFRGWAPGHKHKTVENTIGSAERVLIDCCELQPHSSGAFSHHPAGYAGFSAIDAPRLKIPKGLDDSPARPGSPSLREVRLALHTVNLDLRERLSAAAGRPVLPGQELAAVQEIADSSTQAKWKIKRWAIFTPARDWALLHFLAVTGSRIGATSRLKVGDVTMVETGAGKKPTVALKVGKSKDEEYVSYKPLSPLAYHPFEVMMAIRELMHGGPLPDSWPLFASSTSRQSSFWSQQAMGSTTSGKYVRPVHSNGYPEERCWAAWTKAQEAAAAEGLPAIEGDWFWIHKTSKSRGGRNAQRRGGGEGEKARIWLDGRMTPERQISQAEEEVAAAEAGRPVRAPLWIGSMKPLLPIADAAPFDGWNPHSLRKMASQWLDSPQVTMYLVEKNFIHPQHALSEILEDHEIGSGTATARTYKFPRDVMDQIAAMAIAVMAESLNDSLGARTMPDVETYKTNLRLIESLTAQLSSLTAQRDLVRRSTHESQQAAMGALDEVIEQQMELKDQLREAESIVERIEDNDRKLLVELDDSEPDSELVQVADLVDIKRQVLGLEPGQKMSTRGKVRGWVILIEHAKLSSPTGTAKSAREHVHPDPAKRKRPRGTPPFLVNCDPTIWLDGNKNRRVVPIEAYNPEWLDEGGRREKLNEIVRRWPNEDKWGSYREASYPLPEQLRNELEQLNALEAIPVA